MLTSRCGKAVKTASLDEDRGVGRSGTVIQLGLTRAEIRNVYERVRGVLEQVDSGRKRVF